MKRILLAISAFFVLFQSVTNTQAVGSLKGDFNNDGVVTLQDIRFLIVNYRRNISEITGAVDQIVDGKANGMDMAVTIKEYIPPSPSPSSQIPPGAIEVRPATSTEPGNELNLVLGQYPAGTIYYLRAGIYRSTTLSNLQEGDVLWGETGAIISGARKLIPTVCSGNVQTHCLKQDTDSAAPLLGKYYFVGQTQQTTPAPNADKGQICANCSITGYACKSTSYRCNYNEEFYVNNEMYHHAYNSSELNNPKTFYFDYDRDRIYVSDTAISLSGKTVETSVAQYLISTQLKKIVARNLIVEKYSTPAQHSPLELLGENSIIEYSESRLNHGSGMSVGKSGIVRNNFIHHNGQLGINSGGSTTGGYRSNFLVQENEISYNNMSGFEESWEAGGTKHAHAQNFTLKGNYSHNNEGSGLWVDIDGYKATIDGNILVDNAKYGLQYEISYDAEIKNNFASGNGSSTAKAQLFIQNSQGIYGGLINIYGNTTVADGSLGKDGIIATIENRGYSSVYPVVQGGTCDVANKPTTCMPLVSRNININTNFMYHTGAASGYVGGLYGRGRSEHPDPFNFESNSSYVIFKKNTYYVSDPAWQVWAWGRFNDPPKKDWNTFQSLNVHETNALVTSFTPPQTPAFTVARGQQATGFTFPQLP